MSPKPCKSPDLMSERELLLDLHNRIVGDGTENNPGLDKRLDRVEGFVGRSKWVINIVLGGVIALALDRFKRLFGVA